MKFELTGRLVVEASDIDDAFRKIAEHFALLADGKNSHIPRVGTDIGVKKVGTKTIPPRPKKTTSRPPRRG